jgi:hypothetical protein
VPEAVLIRDAVPGDWPAIWAFMRVIVQAGETFSWDTDTSERDARDGWFRWQGRSRGFTVVAAALSAGRYRG